VGFARRNLNIRWHIKCSSTPMLLRLTLSGLQLISHLSHVGAWRICAIRYEACARAPRGVH
jgi:hypothetical protein